MKRTWLGLALVLAASSLGCGSGTVESEGEPAGEAGLEEEEVASAEEALTQACDPSDPYTAWCNDNKGWQNDNKGWQNDNKGWQNDTNGWTEAWSNGWTSGWAAAWSNAWGASWDNGWSYAGMASFAWTEPQACAHPLSQEGAALASGCNPMATLVCSLDPFCCSTAWDDACVREATTWASTKGTYEGCYTDGSTRALPEYLGMGMTVEQCTHEAWALGYAYAGLQWGGECWAGNSLGHTQVSEAECNEPCSADPTETCGGWWRNSVWQVPPSHPVTVVGGPLSTADSACAAAVITADAFCGTWGWDSICVKEAAQMCVERYVTRPRLEEDRVMIDTCVETKLEGYPACPIAGSGPSGKECCRRALVLNGVYQKVPYTPGYGQEVQWTPTEVTDTALGTAQTVRATIIPDPCVTSLHGSPSCGKMHHLWQGAGPEGTIYPDCSGTSGARPCNNGVFPDQMQETALVQIQAPHRGILLATMSALLTTTDHYLIDVRLKVDSTTLPYHFSIWEREAFWTWSGTNPMVGRPTCIFQFAPQRTGADPAFVEALPYCWWQNWGENAWPESEIATLWFAGFGQ